MQAALLVGQGLHRLGIGAVAHLAVDVRQVLEDLRMPLDRRTIKESLAGRLVLSAPRQEHAQFVRRAIVPRIDREGRLLEGQRLRLCQECVAFDAAAQERLQPAEVVNRVGRFGNAADGRGELRRRVRIIELQRLQTCDASPTGLFQDRRDVRGRQRDRIRVAGRRGIGMAEIVRFAKGDRAARQRAAVKLRVVSGVERVGDELERGQKLAAPSRRRLSRRGARPRSSIERTAGPRRAAKRGGCNPKWEVARRRTATSRRPESRRSARSRRPAARPAQPRSPRPEPGNLAGPCVAGSPRFADPPSRTVRRRVRPRRRAPAAGGSRGGSAAGPVLIDVQLAHS